MTHTQTTAKDFFLHLGAIITLYAGVGFLLNLLFGIINSAFPQIDGYWYQPSISFPVAALIVVTPVFLFLTYLIKNNEERDETKKDIWVRKWSLFLTLFLTGVVVVGDLITLLYFFLDGRELTVAFLLKVLSVLIVAGVVFSYYLLEYMGKSSHRTAWRIGTILGVLIVIVLAFSVIGSPATQRMIRYDTQKIEDLQNIQRQVLNYWQTTEEVPANLDALRDPLSSYYDLPLDPQSGDSYIYQKTGDLSFRLCADFNRPSAEGLEAQRMNTAYRYGVENENWTHGKGQTCFDRTIDPNRYSPLKRPL